MSRSEAQYTLGGQRSGRTAEIYMMLMSKGLAAVDDGTDEFVALLIRPGNNVRITFKKEPEPQYSGKVEDLLTHDDPNAPQS